MSYVPGADALGCADRLEWLSSEIDSSNSVIG
jgi:hypothetical protein